MINIAAFEERGYGREVALIAAAGYRCVYGGEDGEFPVSVFARVEDGLLMLIHGGDWTPPDDDRGALMVAADEFEKFAAACMGIIMEARGAAEEVSDGG